jgi:hypothetical protein
MPRQFVCMKCGVVVDPGELCDCKPMGCYKEIEPEDTPTPEETEVAA